MSASARFPQRDDVGALLVSISGELCQFFWDNALGGVEVTPELTRTKKADVRERR